MSKKEEKQEELQEEMEAVDAAGVSEVEVEATEIENLKAELSEMEDKFLRARAEIANMSNRNKNERELLVRYRSQDLGKKILPSIDNLERAMAIEVSDEQGESLKKGISMVLESITVALKKKELKKSQQWVKPLIQIYIKPFKQSLLLKKPQQIPLLKFYKKGTNYKIVCYDHQWSLLHNNKR